MMNTNENNDLPNAGGRVLTGIIILVVGALLLAQRMGAAIPGWLLSWPMILIVIGVLIAVRHRFQNPAWIILLGLGLFFLAENFYPGLNAGRYLWPVLVIAAGLMMILRPHGKSPRCRNRRFGRMSKGDGTRVAGAETAVFSTPETVSDDDSIDATAIFGGIKKRMMTKNFLGGEIVCIMGGAEIDLSQSDIVGRAEIELVQAFGGTKIIVPAHWNVRSEVAAIFAGFEDRRSMSNVITDANKVLVIRGTSIFGGIEIKSF